MAHKSLICNAFWTSIETRVQDIDGATYVLNVVYLLWGFGILVENEDFRIKDNCTFSEGMF